MKWGKSEDNACPLRSKRQTLEHVLSACKAVLELGRYTWCNKQVLKVLAAVVHIAWLQTKKTTKSKPELKCFLKAGQTAHGKNGPAFLQSSMVPRTGRKSIPTFFDSVQDWETEVDLKGQDRNPEVIRASGLRPDIILHSQLMKKVVLLELTVPWEARIDQQHIFNLITFEDLVAGLSWNGYPTRILALEVGVRGLSFSLANDALKQLGLRGLS